MERYFKKYNTIAIKVGKDENPDKAIKLLNKYRYDFSDAYNKKYFLGMKGDKYLAFDDEGILKFGALSLIKDNLKRDNLSYNKAYGLDELDKVDNIIRTGNIESTNESKKIMKLEEFNDLEYRRGSSEFGVIVTKIMEFLRLYKKEQTELIFNITDFIDKSNISINDIKKMISDEDGKKLYHFDIKIYDDKIYFSKLNNDKSRFFERKIS